MDADKLFFFITGLAVSLLAYFLKDIHQSWKNKNAEHDKSLERLETDLESEIKELRRDLHVVNLSLTEFKVELRIIRESLSSVSKMQKDIDVLHTHMRSTFPVLYKQREGQP
jgi:hypothetical protein